MNKMTIDGKVHEVSGKNVKIVVDDVVIADNLSGTVNIIWEGDLASLKCTQAEIHGNINGDVKTTHLKCMNIYKNVKSVHVKAGIIHGDIKATHVTHL